MIFWRGNLRGVARSVVDSHENMAAEQPSTPDVFSLVSSRASPVPSEIFSHTLLLGEADLSFARALALQGGLSGTVTATELGNPVDVANRYFSGSEEALAARCAELHLLGVRTVLGVDVTRLECNDECHHWRSPAFVRSPLWEDDGSPPVDRVVFNFPHTTRPGKMAKLLLQLFRSVRATIARGQTQPGCTVEMRLRHVGGGGDEGQLLRSRYGHEEAASVACFELISVSESDLDVLANFGYEHRSTKRNARCGHLDRVNIWRWRAAVVAAPSLQRLTEGCRRDVFFVPEAILEHRVTSFQSWKGEILVQYYLVQWRGHPSEDECTWELARDLQFSPGLEIRKAYDARTYTTGHRQQ